MDYQITAKFTLREMNALVKALEESQRTLAAQVGNDPHLAPDAPVRKELGDVADMLMRLRASA